MLPVGVTTPVRRISYITKFTIREGLYRSVIVGLYKTVDRPIGNRVRSTVYLIGSTH